MVRVMLMYPRQSGAMLPLPELHVACLPPADDCAGEDHCPDYVARWREKDGCRRRDLRRRKFGLDKEHW